MLPSCIFVFLSDKLIALERGFLGLLSMPGAMEYLAKYPGERRLLIRFSRLQPELLTVLLSLH
jgi:hypothetical protein